MRTLKIALVAVCAALFLGGCVSPDRVTTEVVWPASETEPAEIVIQWPEGVAPSDIFIGSADGRTLTTAPMPAEATESE